MCEYHQHRIGQRGLTWVGHAHGPGSWKDLAYIFPRSWQDHGKIVLPMYCCCVHLLWFNRCLVALQCGTRMLTFSSHAQLWDLRAHFLGHV